MPQPINPHIRAQLIDLYAQTHSYAAVSRQLGLSYLSVRRICQRYEREGKAGLLPRYSHCGPKQIKSDPLIHRAACWLKRLHPSWGAEFILLQLKERYPTRSLPTGRTLQIWFRSVGLIQAKSRLAREKKSWAKGVHDTWQIDAKEQQRIEDKTPCSWLTITDEHSGSLLAAPLFPPREN